MNLLRIAKAKWDVLAVLSDDGNHCPMLDLLQDIQPRSLSNKMLSLLRDIVPNNGPPKNEEACKPLTDEDGLFEFRKRAGSGPQLRVLWFYDKGRIVICTNAFFISGSAMRLSTAFSAIATT